MAAFYFVQVRADMRAFSVSRSQQRLSLCLVSALSASPTPLVSPSVWIYFGEKSFRFYFCFLKNVRIYSNLA
jgi:hypothetical protein